MADFIDVVVDVWRGLRELVPIFRREARRTNRDVAQMAVDALRRQLTEDDAVATGGTRAAVGIISFSDLSDNHRAVIGALDEEHDAALAVLEEGRGAGLAPPPEEKLVPWAQARGVPEEMLASIAVSIGRTGIPPRRIVSKAYARFEAEAHGRFDRLGRDFVMSVERG